MAGTLTMTAGQTALQTHLDMAFTQVRGDTSSAHRASWATCRSVPLLGRPPSCFLHFDSSHHSWQPAPAMHTAVTVYKRNCSMAGYLCI